MERSMSKSQMLKLKEGFEILKNDQNRNIKYKWKFVYLKPIYERLLQILEEQNENESSQNVNEQSYEKEMGRLLGGFVDQFSFMNSLKKLENFCKESKNRFVETKRELENEQLQQDLNLSNFINPTNDNAEIPLVKACKWNDEILVSILLNLGANVKLFSMNDSTPINWACSKNSTKIIQMLIAKDSTLLDGIGNGYTPLHEACFSHKLKAVMVLIENGANLKAEFIGWTPLNIAARYGDIEIFKILVESDPSLVEGAHGSSVLHEACGKYKCDERYLTKEKLSNKVKMINYLIKQGVSINSNYGYYKDTPLTTATKDGFLDAVKTLKVLKANCWIKNDEYVSGYSWSKDIKLGKTPNNIAEEKISKLKNILKNNSFNSKEDLKAAESDLKVYSAISLVLKEWNNQPYYISQVLGQDIYDESE